MRFDIWKMILWTHLMDFNSFYVYIRKKSGISKGDFSNILKTYLLILPKWNVFTGDNFLVLKEKKKLKYFSKIMT